MELSVEQREELVSTLKARFEANMNRHADQTWDDVLARLEANPKALLSLSQMESSGGEPDLVGIDEGTGEYVFFDCAAESPKGRRSVCYDAEALAARKNHPPKNSAVGLAEMMGVSLLTEDQYQALQQLGDFDNKTSSWLHTPQSIRKLGGAIFGDKRYDRVFVHHNGADSYYASRGFRTCLKV